MWYIRKVRLLDGAQQWVRSGAAPVCYPTLLQAAAVAAAVCRDLPLWHAWPVEIDDATEEVQA